MFAGCSGFWDQAGAVGRAFRGRIERLAALCALAAVLLPAPDVEARPAAGGEAAAPLGKKIAVLSLDALGMEREPVARLEALLRNELERLAGSPLPSRREMQRTLKDESSLLSCGGRPQCLVRIGRKLQVGLVVFGSVASLGDSFILDIKVIDVASGEELRRIESDPLKGNPDELIEAVRVAAYRLLAPERLLGSIMILADIEGAEVELDGQKVGKTPLARPITGLSLGDHRLRVTAPEHSEFDERVRVRFQKTSRVIVQLTVDPTEGISLPRAPAEPRDSPERWYQNKWFWVGAGAAAVVVGGFVGYHLAHDSVIDCGRTPETCR